MEENQCRSVREAMASLLDQKKGGADKPGIKQDTCTGLLTLLQLRAGYRALAEEAERHREAAAEAKATYGQSSLQLRNLEYEATHYGKEIKSCRAFRSAYSDEEINIMPLEEFLATAPPGLRTLEVQADPHQLMLSRLTHELQQRQEMVEQQEALRLRKAEAADVLAGVRKQLASLVPQLSGLQAAAMPIASNLNIAGVRLAGMQAPAELLPLPLYILYSQTIAAQEAFAMGVRAEVVGSLEAARALVAGEAAAAATTVGSGGEESGSASAGRSKRRRADSAASNATDGGKAGGGGGKEGGEDLYQAHPLCVRLECVGPGGASPLAIVFRYLLRLKVVTAVCVDPAHNTILSALFPEDTGATTPSSANRLLQEATFEYDPTRADRPYRWAQQVSGLDFLPDLPFAGGPCPEANAASVEAGLSAYRRQQRLLHVLQQLRARATGAMALKAQLERLSRCHLPLRPTSFKPLASLVAWEALPPADAGQLLLGTDDEEGEFVDGGFGRPDAMARMDADATPAANADVGGEASEGDGDVEVEVDYSAFTELPPSARDGGGGRAVAMRAAPTRPALHRPAGRTFRAAFRRDNAETEFEVWVSEQYPDLPPVWALRSVWDVAKAAKGGRTRAAALPQAQLANARAAIEAEVNLLVVQRVPPAERDQLLAYQCVAAVRAVDAYSQGWLGRAAAPSGGTAKRRGRDQHIVLPSSLL